MAIETNPEYLHHKKPGAAAVIREIVFGLEDGMVSTMGAITGIAAGTHDHLTVVLAGCVVVAVESISMSVGSYLSSKSELAIDERKLHEEKTELLKFPDEEREELKMMYIKDGWGKELAATMAQKASENRRLFLQEMAYRELKIIPEKMEHPFRNGLAMGVSYIIGGLIPLLPYLVFSDVNTAITISISVTLVGLFALGAITTTFSRRSWWKAGLEMLGLASAAALVGYGVGNGIDRLIK